MMELETVKKLIEQAVGEAEVTVGGDGCNLSTTVISSDFEGISRIKQHRMVMDAVKGLIESGELHALSISTYTPEAWRCKNP
jgi:acid stress-induced BolA-like protein IbaG/YrbA